MSPQGWPMELPAYPALSWTALAQDSAAAASAGYRGGALARANGFPTPHEPADSAAVAYAWDHYWADLSWHGAVGGPTSCGTSHE